MFASLLAPSTALKSTLRERCAPFWDKHSALWIGLCLLLGTTLAFHPSWVLCLIWALLVLSVYSLEKVVWGALLAALAFGLACGRHPEVVLPQEKLPGTALFHIEEIKPHSSPFNRSLLYKGTVRSFTAKGASYRDLPGCMYLPLNGKHPPANTDYAIRGTLSQKAPFVFVLKPDKNAPWEAQPSGLNFTQWRFEAKQHLFAYLKAHIDNPKVLTLLYALSCGHVDERILKMEFGKMGLQHILAISGFHFAFFALFLAALLKCFLKHKLSLVGLLLGLTLYALFLGNSPSIQRAYIAISVVVVGQLIGRRSSGLNALGVGLSAEVLLHPLSVLELGFQLSFLCTLAILLFYAPMQKALEWLFVKRSARDVVKMSWLHQHGALLCSLLRSSLALNLAVHLISVPVLLYQFHRFPCLSLAYNLFFPAAVGVSLFLLFLALLFSWAPPVGHALHLVNNAWTGELLQLTSNSPAFLDFSLRTHALTEPCIFLFLTFSFLCGIFSHRKEPL